MLVDGCEASKSDRESLVKPELDGAGAEAAAAAGTLGITDSDDVLTTSTINARQR